MPIVQCKNCGVDLVIDEANGGAYIRYADDSVSCNKTAEDDVPQPTEETPSTQSEV
jgi:hypothetical protein